MTRAASFFAELVSADHQRITLRHRAAGTDAPGIEVTSLPSRFTTTDPAILYALANETRRAARWLAAGQGGEPDTAQLTLDVCRAAPLSSDARKDAR